MDKVPKISITCTASIMWRFLQEALSIDILPPPIVVNTKKLYQIGKLRYREAEFAAYTQQVERDNGAIDICPLDYSITIYVKSIEKILACSFDDRLPPLPFEIYLKHILIHEMLHYLDYVAAYDEARKGNISEMRKYVAGNKGCNKDLYDMKAVEARVELNAINALRRAIMDLNTDYEDRPNLVPKIGGKYDRRRRKWDDKYRTISLIFEYMYMEHIYRFGQELDCIIWDHHYSINKRLYDIQSALIDGQEQHQFEIVE